MNGRVYDYNVGRFLSVDPFVHGGSQGINPYSYIMNNPLAGTDPSGYTPEVEEVKVTEVKTEKVARTGSRLKTETQVTEVSGTVTLSNGSTQDFTANYSDGNVSSVDIGSASSTAKSNQNQSGSDAGFGEKAMNFISPGTGQGFHSDEEAYKQKAERFGGIGDGCEAEGNCVSDANLGNMSAVTGLLGAIAPGPLIVNRALSGAQTTKATINLRGAYLGQVDDLAGAANSLRAVGLNSEQTARILVPLRNSLKMEIRGQGSWVASKVAGLRNTFKYGNKAGPSADDLYRKHGSWDAVLDSLGRTNATVNRATGN